MMGEQGRPFGYGRTGRRTRPALNGLAVLGLAALMLSGCETVNQGSMPVVSSMDEDAQGKEPTLEQMMAVAQASERAGDLRNAVSVYEAIAAKSPGDVAVLRNLGRLQAEMGAADAAIETLGRALALAPQDGEILRGLGGAEIARNRPDLAIPRYEAALAIDGRDVKSLNGLGVSLDRLKRHDEAQARYAQALAIDPTDISVANNQALSLAFAGRTDESLARFQALMQAHGNDRRVRQNYAVALGLAGRLEEYQRVASQDLDTKAVQNNLRVFAALNGLPVPGAPPTALAGSAPAVSPRFAIIDEADGAGGAMPGAGGGTLSRPGPLPRIVAPGGVVLGNAGPAAAPALAAPALAPPALAEVAPRPVVTPPPRVAPPTEAANPPAPLAGMGEPGPTGGLPQITAGVPPSLSSGFGAGDAAMAATGLSAGTSAPGPAPSLADILDLDDGQPSTISGGEPVSGRTLTGDMLARARAARQAAAPDPAATAALVTPPAAAPAAPAAGSGAWVQVGAYPSQDEAQRVLTRLKGKAPEIGTVPSRFEPITRNGMQLVRLRLGPFADAGAANAFCDALRARQAPCFVPGG